MDKDIGSEDNYLTDVSNWICSCPAFISNTFLVCKHIVKACRDRNPSFFPQYATTWRRHDYPLIWFGEARANIDPVNNPWNEMNEIPIDESEISMSIDRNIETSLHNRNQLIESRKVELTEDKKKFESLLKIVSDNIQNDQFYHTYKRLRQVLMNETQACEEALRARTQQRTWNPPRNSRLAFYLN